MSYFPLDILFQLVNVNQQGQTLLQLIDRKDKEDKKDDDVRSDKSKEDISDDWSGNLPRPVRI